MFWIAILWCKLEYSIGVRIIQLHQNYETHCDKRRFAWILVGEVNEINNRWRCAAINAGIQVINALYVRAAQSPPQIRQKVTRRRPVVNVDLNRAAFEYDSAIAYKDLRCIDIGSLSVACQHCNALKFQSETPGLCCAGGKVKLPVLTHPPEPLYSFLYGNTIQSKSPSGDCRRECGITRYCSQASGWWTIAARVRDIGHMMHFNTRRCSVVERMAITSI